jgi:ribosomal protein S27AE
LRLKCPHCGFEGEAEDFTYMYEVTLYLVDSHVEREERERPILVVCPRCKQGFFLESPYSRFYQAK